MHEVFVTAPLASPSILALAMRLESLLEEIHAIVGAPHGTCCGCCPCESLARLASIHCCTAYKNKKLTSSRARPPANHPNSSTFARINIQTGPFTKCTKATAAAATSGRWPSVISSVQGQTKKRSRDSAEQKVSDRQQKQQQEISHEQTLL